VAPAAGRTPKITVWENNRRVREEPWPANGRISVDVAAEGLTTLILEEVKPRVVFQDRIPGRAAPLPTGSVCDLGWRGARAVVLSFGSDELTSAYVYLPDQERTVKSCTLSFRQGDGQVSTLSDQAYPFEFTLPVLGDAPLAFWLEVQLDSVPPERSPTGRLLFK
jgi:hypothetical protein